MKRFHISNGEVAVCRATVRTCPLGGEHFESQEEAALALMVIELGEGADEQLTGDQLSQEEVAWRLGKAFEHAPAEAIPELLERAAYVERVRWENESSNLHPFLGRKSADDLVVALSLPDDKFEHHYYRDELKWRLTRGAMWKRRETLAALQTSPPAVEWEKNFFQEVRRLEDEEHEWAHYMRNSEGVVSLHRTVTRQAASEILQARVDVFTATLYEEEFRDRYILDEVGALKIPSGPYRADSPESISELRQLHEQDLEEFFREHPELS